MLSSAQVGHPRAVGVAEPVRVMVVDDSVVVRGLIVRWIQETPDIEVVSTHRSGRAAVAALDADDPDIVILDIEMPEMDGMTALPLILRKKPDLVVIMASTLTRRNAEISLAALSMGARDYVPKPESRHGLVTADDFRRELLERIRALAPRRAPASAPRRPATPFTLRDPSAVKPRVLLIGSSTGGPPALLSLLRDLEPSAHDMPVLIAQHMPPTFTGILAEHLGRASGRPTAEGRDGEAIVAGRIYVAPGGRHMLAESGAAPTIRLTDTPPVNYCRPAVDPLFASASHVFGAATLAVVLSGMGQDGTQGSRAVAAAGGTVVAQDEATSVVWGMPGSAARAGVCSAVLPLERIAGQLAVYLKGTNA